jgi:hypothetical protein
MLNAECSINAQSQMLNVKPAQRSIINHCIALEHRALRIAH